MATKDYINKITQGECLELIKCLDSESVDCCITSPPYWGLRDYGTAKWEGGDEKCDHKVGRFEYNVSEKQSNNDSSAGHQARDICPKCGATRIDSQVGLEKTPEEYVARLVAVFAEVKRVLKKEGTLWLNLGDSYASYRDGKATPDTSRGDCDGTLVEKGMAKNRMASTFIKTGIKHKDLVGIPWRVAFALQQTGWWLRQDIIWSKPNPMPESVTDRCTKSHEYVFLLAKSGSYYYDNEAIIEDAASNLPVVDKTKGGAYDKDTEWEKPDPYGSVGYIKKGKRNKRSVWIITTKPFKEAHFATFPEDLIEPMVKAGCPKDGIVLDPFMGSGTTGLVATKLGRKFIGFDLNGKYCEMANKRILPYLQQQKLTLIKGTERWMK